MSAPDVVVRRATETDLPAILALAVRSLGWDPGPATEEHFRWKHTANPFGPSPMWVAEADRRVVGFRTFLRWDLRTGTGELRRAVRAVDTATDPDFRGQGIFTQLTLGALEELRDDGVDFVFNTPNQQSRPGYLKMGWRVVGRLPVAIRPAGVGALPRIARARVPAERGAVPTEAGVAAAEVFDDHELSRAILARGTPPRAPASLATARGPEYLAWRYGLPALHYRVVAAPSGPPDGVGVFHLRRRGSALEAVLCELLVSSTDSGSARAVLAEIARSSGADYLIRLRPPGARPGGSGFVPVPAIGPTLTVRTVGRAAVTDLRAWAFTMGDVELF